MLFWLIIGIILLIIGLVCSVVATLHKRSRKKRECPYCSIFLEYLETDSTYQCPECKKKYYLGENIGINKSENEKKLTKLFTGINLDVQLDKNIDHMLYFRYKNFNRKKIMDYYKNKM